MRLKPIFNLKVIVGSLILAAILLISTLVYILYVDPLISKPETKPFLAEFTIIPAMTSTPRYVTPTLAPASPTIPATSTALPGMIAVNTYVQITGTEGEGLRLRVSPGLTSDPLFIGGESEVFLVTAGPSQADGYTWWYLTAPYDQTRSGWAVSSYLTYVPSP